jgi:acyl carrier protein/NADP-dependent 3-hydroxy acid dehydrogenase YdfG
MAESHQAFLLVAEKTLAVLAGGAGTSTIAESAGATEPPPGPSPGLAGIHGFPPQSMPVAPRMPWADATPVVPRSSAPENASAYPPSRQDNVSPVGPNLAAAGPAAGVAATSGDVTALVMTVVTEKTGYPADMLNLDMELEAELGIDSIKQVEILSAIRDRVSGLPEPDPARLADLRTLRQIIAMISAAAPVSARPPAAADPATPVSVAADPSASRVRAEAAEAAASPQASDIASVLLAVVTEKTGYPGDMLNLDMELEAELGIDSIKQVEILSALRERLPNLPEVDPAQMASLRNLRSILAFVGAVGEKPSPASSAEWSPAPSSTTTSSRETVERYVLELANRPACGFTMPALRSAKLVGVASLGADGAVAAAVVAELDRRGVRARALTHPEQVADALILLDLDDSGDDSGGAIAATVAALGWASALARRCEGGHGLLVTVHDGGGAFGLRPASRRAWRAGLPALVKTARREWPKADVKAIDLDVAGRDTTTLARTIVDEMIAGGPEIEVGLRADGRRLVPVLRPADLARDGPPRGGLRDGMTLVVSGGARGITAQALLALAGRHRLRLALLGRTPLEPEPDGLSGATDEPQLREALVARSRAEGIPMAVSDLTRTVARILAAREIRATLSALESLESRVRYIVCDAAESATVGHAMEAIRADWGPIHGLIHAAGVLADKRIRDKTPEQAQQVAATKIGGLAALLQGTADDPLELIVCFSSASATFGNPGQADYAMANEVLNKVAEVEAHRRTACVVKSIAWGPWDGGMVRDGLRTLFRDRGVPLIPPAAGGEFLVRELTAGDRNVEVVAGTARMGGEEVWRSSVAVGRHDHPFVADHAVDGRPILPMVLVLEWFHRFASAIAPGRAVRELCDLSALKGIVFERGLEAVQTFLLVGHSRDGGVPGGRYDLSLLDAEGRTRYTAQAVVGDSPATPVPLSAPTGEPRAWPWHVDEVYHGPLFHGPAFRVLHSLEEFSADGGAACLKATDAMEWPGGPWRTDPATLDGGLQLARLWALNVTGRAFLPTRIASVMFNGAPAAAGRRRCMFQSRLDGASKSLSDIAFTDADDRVLAVMQGVEMYATSTAPTAELVPGE